MSQGYSKFYYFVVHANFFKSPYWVGPVTDFHPIHSLSNFGIPELLYSEVGRPSSQSCSVHCRMLSNSTGLYFLEASSPPTSP